MKKRFTILYLTLSLCPQISLAQNMDAPVKTSQQWQKVLNFKNMVVELDRVSSKGWETKKVNMIYRYRFKNPVLSSMSPRDEEIYSVLIDCQAKEFWYIKKSWYYKNNFVYEYKYINSEPKIFLSINQIEYEIASIACRTPYPEK